MSDPALPATATTLNSGYPGRRDPQLLLETDEAQPTAPTSNPGDRWWVMVHVDGQKRPDNQDDPPDSYYKGLSWQPPLGREFDLNNWDDWVISGSRLMKVIAEPGTSVIFRHEVWDHNADAPGTYTLAHERRSGWVKVNIIAKDGNPPPVDPVDPVDTAMSITHGDDGERWQ